ncbi:prepilin peptidase [Patescibacteria group bacterium]|nr:prepilin peptidase [Patescibacteria group bacterium]
MIDLVFFLFGSSIGSFLNVLIDRPSKGEGIGGRSHCDYCQEKIIWYDLVPILSFLFLKGKSRCCHKRLSLQYPLVEIITGLVFVFILKNAIFGQGVMERIILLGMVSTLIVVFFSDFKYQLISDWTLLSFFVFSALFHMQGLYGSSLAFLSNRLTYYFVSGLVIGLPIFLIYFFSKEKAMGLGDVYLSVVTGFLLGASKGFIALYIAFVCGAIYGLILIVARRKKMKSRVAFGPFIVLGCLTLLFYGNSIIDAINKIYGL